MESQYNDEDRRREIATKRYRDFQSRKRTEGDRVTWVIVLSSLVGMFNIFSPSYGREPRIALYMMILFVGWFLAMTFVAKVNVVGILWGRTIKDLDENVNERFVLLASLAMPLVSAALLLWDLVSDRTFGLYGILGAVFAALLLYIIGRGLQANDA